MELNLRLLAAKCELQLALAVSTHMACLQTQLTATESERDKLRAKLEASEETVGIANRCLFQMQEAAKLLSAELAELRAQVPELECYSKSHQGWRACGHPESCSNEKRYIYARPVPPAAVPDDVAEDAERYRFIRDRAVTGAVQTQLPLYRVHHWHNYEPVTEFPNLDDAIDAAILAANKESAP